MRTHNVNYITLSNALNYKIMPKPIVVLKVETHIYGHDYEKLRNIETMFARRFEKDYYLVAVPLASDSEEPIRLEVHFDKNFSDAKFTKLKEHVANLINHTNGSKVEINRETVIQLLLDHPPMLTDVQVDMWKAYGYYDKFALNPQWHWNMEQLNSMDGYALLRLHNEIESFK